MKFEQNKKVLVVRVDYSSLQRILKPAFEVDGAIIIQKYDLEAMRARGIIVLEKSNTLVKKISRQNIFRKLKQDCNPFLPPKHYKYGGRFLLHVGDNI